MFPLHSVMSHILTMQENIQHVLTFTVLSFKTVNLDQDRWKCILYILYVDLDKNLLQTAHLSEPQRAQRQISNAMRAVKFIGIHKQHLDIIHVQHCGRGNGSSLYHTYTHPHAYKRTHWRCCEKRLTVDCVYSWDYWVRLKVCGDWRHRKEKGCDFSPRLHSILPLDDAGLNNEFVSRKSIR